MVYISFLFLNYCCITCFLGSVVIYAIPLPIWFGRDAALKRTSCKLNKQHFELSGFSTNFAWHETKTSPHPPFEAHDIDHLAAYRHRMGGMELLAFISTTDEALGGHCRMPVVVRNGVQRKDDTLFCRHRHRYRLGASLLATRFMRTHHLLNGRMGEQIRLHSFMPR